MNGDRPRELQRDLGAACNHVALGVLCRNENESPPGIEQQAHTRAGAFAGPLSYRVLPRVELDHHDGAIEEAHRRKLALHDDPIMRGRHVQAEDVSCVARIVVTLLVVLGASSPTTDLGIQLQDDTARAVDVGAVEVAQEHDLGHADMAVDRRARLACARHRGSQPLGGRFT